MSAYSTSSTVGGNNHATVHTVFRATGINVTGNRQQATIQHVPMMAYTTYRQIKSNTSWENSHDIINQFLQILDQEIQMKP